MTKELQDSLVVAGNAPWFEDNWGGVETFVERGFGFVAVGPEGIASNCRACPIVDSVVPMQVSTRAYARGQGLATAACDAFIKHCLSLGLTPEYSCLADNLPSIALARKLGFVLLPES